MNEQDTRQLTTPGDYAQAVIALLNNARVSVDIFSPALTPIVFAGSELVAAVREFALRSQHGTMRVLIRDTEPLTRDGHRFLELAQRISSKISVRALATDFHSRDDAFVVADERSYVQRRQASTWTGVHDLSRPAIARQLLTVFNEMWEHSLPDPGIRRLHI